MADERRKALKAQLVVALAQGEAVRTWARGSDVPLRTAYRWASLPEVCRAAESFRHHLFGRAAGMLAKRANWARDQIATIARNAESESVRLAACRALLPDRIVCARCGKRTAASCPKRKQRMNERDHVSSFPLVSAGSGPTCNPV
jgi:hypothetical protein